MKGAMVNQQNVSYAIVDRIADLEGAIQADLEPLYSCIDPDALKRIVQSGGQDIEVEFDYEGHTVHVDSSGRVSVNGG